MPIIGFDESLYRITGRPEDHNEVAFDVYQHYLENVKIFIKSTYPTFNDFVDHVLGRTTKLQIDKHLDLSYVRRMLFLGWNTEHLVRLNDSISNIEIIRINNSWKPIQVYYSVYSLAEAACYTITNNKAGAHKSCLERTSQYLISSKISPWNYAYSGCKGKSVSTRTIKEINIPCNTAVPNSLQRNNIKPIQAIALCLRAEHNNRIADHKKKKGEIKYLYDPGNTTLLHFLYRLRIKSNYKDVEEFLADAPSEKIEGFSKNLTIINAYTNTLFELIIARKIGKIKLIQIMEEYKKMVMSTYLSKRINLYNGLKAI
jgi:hypothetical protein